MGEGVCEAFLRIVELGLALGVKDLAKRGDLWEHALDKHWLVAVNGSRKPQKTRGGVDVPGLHAYVEWNGWPAGLLTARGGTLAAGAAANEETLMAALDAAIAKATEPPGGKGDR